MLLMFIASLPFLQQLSSLMRHLFQRIGCLDFQIIGSAAPTLHRAKNNIAALHVDDRPPASTADKFHVGISRWNHRNLTAHRDTAATAFPAPPATPLGTSRNWRCSLEPGLRLANSSSDEPLMTTANRCLRRRGTPRRGFTPQAGRRADAPALLTSHTSLRAL